jgi:hypothetical protein
MEWALVRRIDKSGVTLQDFRPGNFHERLRVGLMGTGFGYDNAHLIAKADMTRAKAGRRADAPAATDAFELRGREAGKLAATCKPTAREAQ